MLHSAFRLIRGLSAIGLKYRVVQGNDLESSLQALCRSLDRDQPVIVSCMIPYRGKSVRHYAVLVAIDGKNLYFADPFPHKDTPDGSLRIVPWVEFHNSRWSRGSIIWGRDRWALEVAS